MEENQPVRNTEPQFNPPPTWSRGLPKSLQIVLWIFAAGVLLVGGYVLYAQSKQDRNEETKINNAPENTTYQIAKTLGAPYKCSYAAPSFFGEKSAFEAEVLRDDFLSIEVPSSWDVYREESYGMPPLNFLRFAKKDGWAYMWLDNGNGPELADGGGGKFNYKKVRDALPSTSTHFENILVFAEPDPDSECIKISSANIIVPNLSFKDIGDFLVEELTQNNQEEIGVKKSITEPTDNQELIENKIADKIKQTLGSIRIDAELLYNLNLSYSGICKDEVINSDISEQLQTKINSLLDILKVNNQKAAGILCLTNGKAYSIEISRSSESQCIDSTGFSVKGRIDKESISCNQF